MSKLIDIQAYWKLCTYKGMLAVSIKEEKNALEILAEKIGIPTEDKKEEKVLYIFKDISKKRFAHHNLTDMSKHWGADHDRIQYISNKQILNTNNCSESWWYPEIYSVITDGKEGTQFVVKSDTMSCYSPGIAGAILNSRGKRKILSSKKIASLEHKFKSNPDNKGKLFRWWDES